MKKYKAMDIARYVINYAISKGHPISNLQLQKILYYVQAAFLVKNGEPIFDEKILNWTYGPVIDEVYTEYRINGDSTIEKQDEYVEVVYDKEKSKILLANKKFDESQFESGYKALINSIVDIYMDMDPFDLVEKTHLEDPWMNSSQNDVICTESIKLYYKENIDKLYNKN